MGHRWVVGAVLVDDLDAPTLVLGARRTSPARLAGCWELPGGKVEPGELPEDALRRELAEELGVEVALGEELPGPDDGCWPISPGLTMRLWWAVAGGPPVPGPAHDRVRWFTTGTWGEVPWLPADVAALSAVDGVLARA